MMKDVKDIVGVIPAMVSCFDADGNFDEQAQRELTRFLLRKKVDGLYLAGSTGESFLMTEQARKQVVETVSDEVKGQIPLIVHVGDIGTGKSIEFARHAQRCGAAAISSVPPFYFKFTPDEIVSYYEDVSASVDLPMIVYNIALAGLVDFNTIKRLSKIPTVQGIKYTATTHNEILRIKDEISPDFSVYSGADEMALSGFAFGADGIIGSFYNVIPELFQIIWHATRENDLPRARDAQNKANVIIYYVLKNHFFDCIKAMLNWAGISAGTVLSPFYKLNKEDETRIKREMKALIIKYNITECEVLNRIREL